MKIIFMGSPEEVIYPLEAISKSPKHQLIAVVSQPSRPAGRGGKELDPPVAQWAKQNNVLCLQPPSAKADDFLEELRGLSPDVIVTAAYGQILSDEFLKIPRRATINIHPSKLPEYRGATPVPQALLNGHKSTALTILFTVKKLDAGNIILQKDFAIQPKETSGDLTKRLFLASSSMIIEAINLLEDPLFVGEPQNDQSATFCKKIAKESGEIDWSLPAESIFNRYRAHEPWPGTWSFLAGKRISITDMSIEDSSIQAQSKAPLPGSIIFDKAGRRLMVATSQGSLGILQLKPAGGKIMDAVSFWNGVKDKTSARFGPESATS
jgi:methionyl-tRNA formyltransferase